MDNLIISSNSKVTSIFNNCKSLISLNLTNFENIVINSQTNIFSGCSSNTIFCFNEANADNIISLLNSQNIKYINNCSQTVFKKNENIFDDIIKTTIYSTIILEEYKTYYTYHSNINEEKKTNYIDNNKIDDNYSKEISDISWNIFDYLNISNILDIDNPSIVDIKKYINISNGILGNCETK